MRAVASPPPASAQREFAFTASDFVRVRRLIHARAGIALGAHKQEMVYSRLAHRLRARGLTSFKDYLDSLQASDAAEREAFINALTTKLTSFFREPHHFEILAARAPQWARGRRCRIWCAGAATGEEPYSLAMTLVETFGSWTPPCELIATDLDTAALQEAERGAYPLPRLERVGPGRRERFFCLSAGQARVREELRRLVRFQPLNLLAREWPLIARFDAIFCRNVLIYFDRPTQQRVVRRFHPWLRPEGLMFLGHAEGLGGDAALFRPLGRTVYEPVRSASYSAAWARTAPRDCSR